MIVIVPLIVQQHVEDAALYWLRRDDAVAQPHYDLDDLAKLDDQLNAHLDGLQIADQPAWEMCVEELAWEEPGEVFPIGVLSLKDENRQKWQVALEAVQTADPQQDKYLCSRALVSALGWLSWPEVESFIQDGLQDTSPTVRRIALAGAAVHRQELQNVLLKTCSDQDEALQTRALLAAGELGRMDLSPQIQSILHSSSGWPRFTAAWSLARLSAQPEAWQALQQIVEAQAEGCKDALQMALRTMPVETASQWINQLATQGLNRQAVIGSGILGTPDALPWLLEVVKIPELSRVAGEAISMITGLDLAYQDLEDEWPEGFEAGPNDDPEEEDVEMDPDENLPWPHRELLLDWWSNHQHEFESGVRYLCGQPLEEAHLQNVLREGFQRQRAAAALELALLHPDQPLFNVRAPGFRQKEMLGV